MSACAVPTCLRRPYARGLCDTHYRLQLKTARALLTAERAGPPPVCEVCGDRLAVGPLECICSPCYHELRARIAAAPSFREHGAHDVRRQARPRSDYSQ